MQIVEIREFEFEGNKYEVRALADEGRFEIAAYVQGQRANGYSYSVDAITDIEIATSKGFSGYRHLMDVAESDIKEKRWDQYLKALQEIGWSENSNS